MGDEPGEFQSTRGPEGPRDPDIQRIFVAQAKFQSTRGPEGPRDVRRGRQWPCGSSFNPRAAPRGHATGTMRGSWQS